MGDRERCLVPLVIAFTVPGLPQPWVTGLTIAGVGLFLFGSGLPQRISRRMAAAHVNYLEGAWSTRQSEDAQQMCRAGAASLAELTAGRRSPFGARPVRLSPGRRQRSRYAVVTYEQLHRAEVVRAVEAGIAAGAKDGGLLTLARDPRGMSDLSGLQAGLLRIVVELGEDSV